MKGKDAAGNQVALVERNSLRGEQMEWYGVTRERVDNQHVEVLRGLGGKRCPRVSFDYINRGS